MRELLPGAAAVVVPWHSPRQRDAFLSEWKLDGGVPGWVVLQHDANQEGCAVTKNKGVAEAVASGAEVVVVLDDDCFPDGKPSLEDLVARHVEALKPQPFPLFEAVTTPPSRGTPYQHTDAVLPVAASMGFWSNIGDYCAVRGLAYDHKGMSFSQRPKFWRYFPLCGMNLAFRPKEWDPWCRFIDVPRFDDIWMGWLWQREAYRRGHCFNLAGPVVRHSRQSNVWSNLKLEAQYLLENETLWKQIALAPNGDYASLRALLPV